MKEQLELQAFGEQYIKGDDSEMSSSGGLKTWRVNPGTLHSHDHSPDRFARNIEIRETRCGAKGTSRDKVAVGTEPNLVEDRADHVVYQRVSDQANSDTEYQQRLTNGAQTDPGIKREPVPTKVLIMSSMVD